MIRDLFGLTLIPCLFSPLQLLPMAPIFAYHFLSSAIEDKSLIQFWYGISIVPFIMLSVASTMGKMRNLNLRLTLCIIIFITCLIQLRLLYPIFEWESGLKPQSIGALAQDKQRLINKIPLDAGVIATSEFLPALTLREHLYSFHKIYSREFQEPQNFKNTTHYTGHKFILPEQVHYAILNLNNLWLNIALKNEKEFVTQKMNEFLKDWDKIDGAGSIVLLKRKP
jgi:hypothetical protein